MFSVYVDCTSKKSCPDFIVYILYKNWDDLLNMQEKSKYFIWKDFSITFYSTVIYGETFIIFLVVINIKKRMDL